MVILIKLKDLKIVKILILKSVLMFLVKLIWIGKGCKVKEFIIVDDLEDFGFEYFDSDDELVVELEV